MENYTCSSSHTGSGDSPPRSREIECGTAAAVSDEAPPSPAAASARVKVMCSYGGRIQPRSHDNQLSYVGGDTKILAVDRSICYLSIIAKLSVLSSSSSSDDVILKYQLPGEDLDALISVTNDEDLEHMMIEYDRLHRTGSKPVPRLRLFLFSAMGKGSQDRACFADPPTPVVTTPKQGPDYLFGLEAAATTTNFLQPEAAATTMNFLQPEAEVKDPAAKKAGIEVAPPPAKSAEAVVPTQEELQGLQIAEKQQQQLNGSDETLTRSYPAEYYAPPPPVQEKAPPALTPATAQPPAYWQDPHRSVAPAPGPRFASFMGGDGKLYLIPTNSGVYPASAAPGQTYYTAVQRVMPTAAYDNSPAVFGAATPQQAKAPTGAYDNGGVRAQQQQAVEVTAAGYGGGVAPPPAVSAGAYDNGAGYAAYDNTGRPVYYAGPGATYQTVNNVAIATESKVLKPSQVS